MTKPTKTPDNSARYIIIPELFTLQDHLTGTPIDLTPLIADGAKLTVLLSAYKRITGTKIHTGDKHYFRLYRALKSWEKRGLVTIRQYAYDSNSIEPDQRPGLFIKATQAAYTKNPYLIDGVQNSKSCAKDTDTPSEDDLQTSAKHPLPQRCGWHRAQAIKTISDIRTASWFTRDPKTKKLNPNLTTRLNRVNTFFTEWDKETQTKCIILQDLKTKEYKEMPYKTRFNDDGRKLANVKIYNTGIENSLKKHQEAVFLTLTTDPLIWMTEKDRPIIRHIKVDGKTSHLNGTGQGGNLLIANRHESQAWRKWYEKICHRYGRRVPYIRCVEFQENGLIHTHVLLFGITWEQQWYEFAEEWGTRYNQGFLNKAYHVVNDGEKWTWKGQRPNDAKGRSPADYLKKYLIKSMYDSDGFYMYWACNKRFFTMSESLRYYSFDEKIAEEDWLRENAHPNTYEFVGSCNSNPADISSTIKAYERKKYGVKPAYFTDGKPIDPYHGAVPHWLNDALYNVHLANIENPDEYDEPEQQTAPQEMSEYDMMIEEEARQRAERRKERERKRKVLRK